MSFSRQTSEEVEAMYKTVQTNRINFETVIKSVQILKTSTQSVRNNEKKTERLVDSQIEAAELNDKEPILQRQRKVSKTFEK